MLNVGPALCRNDDPVHFCCRTRSALPKAGKFKFDFIAQVSGSRVCVTVLEYRYVGDWAGVGKMQEKEESFDFLN